MKRYLSIIFIGLFFFAGTLFSYAYGTDKLFGTEKESSRPDVKIYFDEFSLQKTYEYYQPKDIGKTSILFRKGGLSTDDLFIHPVFIFNEGELCVIELELLYLGSSGGMWSTAAKNEFKKFIFMANGQRLEIDPQIPGKVEYKGRSIADYDEYANSFNLKISKEQYDTLNNYFADKDKIECVVYTKDNKVIKLTTENIKTHKAIFKALEEAVYNDYENPIYVDLSQDVIITVK